MTRNKPIKEPAGLKIVKGIPSIDRVTMVTLLSIHGAPIKVAKALHVGRVTVFKTMKFYAIKTKVSYE